MTKQPFKDTFDRNRFNLKDSSTKSQRWFQQQVSSMRGSTTPERLMKETPSDLKSRLYPGFLYMFFYDPKHKDTLPYYDRFPLVFPYSVVKGGFIGLNMHYLPYQLRIRLLDSLMVYASNSKMDQRTKIMYSWNLIGNVSKFAPAKPCIKQYLTNHVTSPFKKIEAKDWATAMMLPVEQFTASKQKIWADSKRKMI